MCLEDAPAAASEVRNRVLSGAGAYNVRMFISDRRTLLPFVFALATAAGACQSSSTPAAAPAAAAAASPDVWATVDGREVRREAIEKVYRRSVQPGTTPSEEEALTAKLNLLEQAILDDLIIARAKELNILLPDADVDAAFNEGKKNLPEDAFNKELAARNLTAADMREEVRKDLTAQKVMERDVTSKVVVSDKDVNDFYDANKAQFNLTEDAFHLAQIVITAQRDQQIANRTGDDAATPQAATQKAQMLMEKLKAGTPFPELAMDFSEDPNSAPRGGDVGLVGVTALNQAPKPLRDTVLKLEPGNVDIVAMEGGYTLVALVAKQAKGQRDLSSPEVKNGITTTLRDRREQLLRTAYLSAIRNKANVVNLLARRIVDGQGAMPPTLAPTAPK